MPVATPTQSVIIVGAGPSGLMAAEHLSAAGVAVDLFDAMPSVGRKFLLAGKGGLNLTHAEPVDRFVTRYGARQALLTEPLQDFGPQQVREWAKSLGVDTFVGTSGHVFPTDMKAAPLLRAWLTRLRHPQSGPGVRFHMRHRWNGGLERGADGVFSLSFDTAQGTVRHQAPAVVLALGGGSWARLGSDGAWVPWLRSRDIEVAPLRPANCGFDVASPRAQAPCSRSEAEPTVSTSSGWSAHFTSRHAGEPFKSVAISVATPDGVSWRRLGEFVATATGLEGSLIYAASSLLRNEIAARGSATFWLDLLPDLSAQRVLAEVSHPRGSRSLSSHLKSRLHLQGIKAAILFEILAKDDLAKPQALAGAIKALPIRLVAARPIDEAISSAGGVRFEGLDHALMVTAQPGLFCVGEMLDWEAPTGGYLLTACLATGVRAAQGVRRYLS
ncbi:TIGR03862 family flavoprotein [Rhodoferax sp.]|uniref:TIGR03862 family flavoprotein n=1 Tax=Rhodoferax sp. TaxID=50421 RepID=UPI0027433E1E|nr:TIGR03862 family flavoprotein [Rhodoferax sp.]